MREGAKADEKPEDSEAVARSVAAAQTLQLQRQNKLNARLAPGEVARYCTLAKQPRALLSMSIARLGLSARAYRVLKVARTCADLGGAPDIRIVDVAEAVKLRALDRPTC